MCVVLWVDIVRVEFQDGCSGLRLNNLWPHAKALDTAGPLSCSLDVSLRVLHAQEHRSMKPFQCDVFSLTSELQRNITSRAALSFCT